VSGAIPKGFRRVHRKPYKVVKQDYGRRITLHEMTYPDGREFVEYVDDNGNILLVDKNNLTAE
jgi:hypothetical protein